MAFLAVFWYTAGMKTLSMDLRERILASYDAKEGTRQEIANRFRVSLGMVKKLLSQRRRMGHIGPLHKNAGRKPMITLAHRREIKRLLRKQPDMTLAELRDALGLRCSLPAIHYVLADMNLTLKKRRSEPVNNSVKT
jgi:transposase